MGIVKIHPIQVKDEHIPFLSAEIYEWFLFRPTRGENCATFCVPTIPQMHSCNTKSTSFTWLGDWPCQLICFIVFIYRSLVMVVIHAHSLVVHSRIDVYTNFSKFSFDIVSSVCNAQEYYSFLYRAPVNQSPSTSTGCLTMRTCMSPVNTTTAIKMMFILFTLKSQNRYD